MLTARMKSRKPWEAGELAPLAEAIVEAKGNGLSDDSPALRAGIELKSKLEKTLVLQEDMEAALRSEPKLSELRNLLHRSDQLDVNPEVGGCCATDRPSRVGVDVCGCA